MISARSGIPKYLQVAARLRERILSGEIRPGYALPPRTQLALEMDVGTGTVERAMDELRREGLIMSGSGKGTFARDAPERQEILLGQQSRVIARMPTRAERERLDLDGGVPVVEVTRRGESTLYPADGYEFRTR